MHGPRAALGLAALLLLCAPVPLGHAADEPPQPEQAQKADDHPPVFSHLSLTEAKEKNKTDGRILVVKATAVWCGPCKKMDKTTWREADVEAWFKAKGTAISLDVDAQTEDAQALRIQAMPTMVAFKAGQEVDRLVGYKSGAELLTWLGAVERGETASSRLTAKLAKPREGAGALSMQDRMELARELMQADRNAEAADEYVWLFENMTRIQPSMSGVRVSYLTSDMQRLASGDETAKTKFTALRDKAHERMTGKGKRIEDLQDWIVLNEVIGDEQATLAWWDRAKDKPGAAKALERVEHHIVPLLEAHERWADMGRLLERPLEKLADDARTMKMMADTTGMGGMGDPQADAEMRKQMLEYAHGHFRESAGRMYASLIAAGRDAEAAELAEQAMKTDPADPELMGQELVRTAIRANVARESMKELIKERPLPDGGVETGGKQDQELSLEERNRREHAKVVSDGERGERRAQAMSELEESLKGEK